MTMMVTRGIGSRCILVCMDKPKFRRLGCYCFSHNSRTLVVVAVPVNRDLRRMLNRRQACCCCCCCCCCSGGFVAPIHRRRHPDKTSTNRRLVDENGIGRSLSSLETRPTAPRRILGTRPRCNGTTGSRRPGRDPLSSCIHLQPLSEDYSVSCFFF